MQLFVQLFAQRSARFRSVLLGAAAVLAASSCGGGAPVGPDALRPEILLLYQVNGAPLPVKAYDLAFGGSVWVSGARLEPAEAGRGIDPRIFEDRSGNGSSGGSTRDSTTAAARMLDVRDFEERAGTTVVNRRTDTSPVTVERRGDLILITREHPDPTRTTVDTGFFVGGSIQVRVREWERFARNANAQFSYSISK